MNDLFDYLKIDTKEDVYTFCLYAFLSKSFEYRKASASFWGFEGSEDYKSFRCSVNLDTETENGRTKITPDLILCNEKHVAIIESKMYSSEGWGQTKDYKDNIDRIKSQIGEITGCDLRNADVKFYFFTLSGISANTEGFASVRWADYYAGTLSKVSSFGDEYLDIIRKAIINRAEDYLNFEKTYNNRSYSELVDNCNNSWIRPYSLFSSGLLDNVWGISVGDSCDQYKINNGIVNGRGHSTFITDITDNSAWGMCGQTEEDNIWLFTRIEWNRKSVDIFLNWEYWKVSPDKQWTNYIPFGKLNSGLKEKSKDNRRKCCEELTQFCRDGISIPAQKDNMLHMLKCTIEVSENDTIGKVIDEVKTHLEQFFKAARLISNSLVQGKQYLEFVERG